MTKWYSIQPRYAKAEIDVVEVLRETEQCLFLPTKRHGKSEERAFKQTEWIAYYPTWADAHNRLLEMANSQLASAIRAAERARSVIAEIEAMQELTP